jgi:hypothetical protein
MTAFVGDCMHATLMACLRAEGAQESVANSRDTTVNKCSSMHLSSSAFICGKPSSFLLCAFVVNLSFPAESLAPSRPWKQRSTCR